MNLLTVNGLSKLFGARAVLDNVSFSVREGEVLGLIGPNGAGKTTLFECMAGLHRRDAGEIRSSPLFYLPDAIRPWPDQRVSWALRFFEELYGPGKRETIDSLNLAPVLNSRIAS